jgi:hypothetical protein
MPGPPLPRLTVPVDRDGCRAILNELLAFHNGIAQAFNDRHDAGDDTQLLNGGALVLAQFRNCLQGLANDMMPLCPDGYSVLQSCPTCDVAATDG